MEGGLYDGNDAPRRREPWRLVTGSIASSAGSSLQASFDLGPVLQREGPKSVTDQLVNREE